MSATIIKPDTSTITLADVREYFINRIVDESLTIEEHRGIYIRAVQSEQLLESELKKLTIPKLQHLVNIYASRDIKKPELVERALEGIFEDFALDKKIESANGGYFILSHHDYAAAEAKRKVERRQKIDQAVASLTAEDLASHRAKILAGREKAKERQEEKKKAVSNPETEEEFEEFIYHHGIRALLALKEKKQLPRKSDEQQAILRREGIRAMNDDQLARWDEIQAAKGQERRAAQMIERATIRRIEIGEGNYMEIVRRYHTRRECDQWIVVLAEREDRTTFEELCIAARKLGGDYQRAYVPANSPGGFAFYDEQQAEKFVQLQSKDVFEMARLERLVARRDRVRSNAVEHFTGLAGRMEERAGQSLARPRLENTERRIMLAGNARDTAQEQLAMAGTLRNTAIALQGRLARHTDRIRWRTHAEAFNRLLDSAGGQMARVEYPWPRVGKHTLSEIAKQIGERDGSILITQRIVKLCRETAGEVVTFAGDYLADTLRHFYRRARFHRVRGWALDRVREALGDFKRCRLNNLENLPELRAALREHSGRRVEPQAMTKAEKVMRDLYPGQFPPDYFPTPRDVVELMLEYADMEDGMFVLEPSAGSGHIANVVRELCPSSRFRLVEISGLLFKALTAQQWQPGAEVIQTDFLKLDLVPDFDRIIMDPPFGCDGIGTDIDHVRHAYTMLKPGGRLVSLVSDGVFYRGDAKAQEFRSWLEEEIEEGMPRGFDFELPEGAFLNSDRPTSWAARIVVISN